MDDKNLKDVQLKSRILDMGDYVILIENGVLVVKTKEEMQDRIEEQRKEDIKKLAESIHSAVPVSISKTFKRTE